MNSILLADSKSSDVKIKYFLSKFSDKVRIYPPGSCPVTVQLSLLQAAKSQTCGKCVPCREGTKRMLEILERIVEPERQIMFRVAWIDDAGGTLVRAWQCLDSPGKGNV